MSTDLTNNDDNKDKSSSLFNLPLLEQDLFWEDEELRSFFSKQEKQLEEMRLNVDLDICVSLAHREVENGCLTSMLIMALYHSLQHWP